MVRTDTEKWQAKVGIGKTEFRFINYKRLKTSSDCCHTR